MVVEFEFRYRSLVLRWMVSMFREVELILESEKQITQFLIYFIDFSKIATNNNNNDHNKNLHFILEFSRAFLYFLICKSSESAKNVSINSILTQIITFFEWSSQNQRKIPWKYFWSTHVELIICQRLRNYLPFFF